MWGVAGVGRSQGHFVVEADDGEDEEQNGVFGAEGAFVVHVDVQKLVERARWSNRSGRRQLRFFG